MVSRDWGVRASLKTSIQVSCACRLGKKASEVCGPLMRGLSSGWSKERESTGEKGWGRSEFGVLISKGI